MRAESDASLSALLRCPQCCATFETADASLVCPNEHRYPVIGGVPRLVAGDWSEEQSVLVAETGKAFGDQWTALAEDAVVTRRDLELHLPRGLDLSVFSGRVLDLGCGMGRYTALVAELGAEAVGLDVSRAVDTAARLWPNARFVQADVVAAPFAPASFDVVFSFGVLHHLPDPLRGFRSAFGLVKPGGLLLVWVYSAHGGLPRRIRVALRRVVHGRPALLRPLAWLAALSLYWLHLRPLQLLGRRPKRFLFHADKGFRQLYVDCHDALAAPTEVYMSEAECRCWLESVSASAGGAERRSDGSGWIIWARP